MHLSAHLDLDVLAHEADDTLSVLVELTAPSQPSTTTGRAPSTLVVVLDRSGSMAGDRLEQAKAALITLIERLDPQDHFGLVTFDQHTRVEVPAGPLTDEASVRRRIAAVHPGGSTDLSGGYLRGLQEARRVAGPAGATLLLISDGHANAGLVDPVQLGGIARLAQSDRITTTTLGMGLGYDERLLSAIAAGGAGNEHFAESADQATALIAGEVDGLLSMVAQAASLRVIMSPHARAVQVINDLSVVGLDDGVMIELGSFYAGESRKLIMTFDVPGIAALGLAEIAELTFAYVALPALEQQTLSWPLHVNVVPGDEAAGRIPDPVVRTEAAFQQAQRAKREASTAYSSGDHRTASAALRRARTLLDRAAAAAPAPMAAELGEELRLLSALEQEASYGDVARAAKLSSADAARKSRTRGRRTA